MLVRFKVISWCVDVLQGKKDLEKACEGVMEKATEETVEKKTDVAVKGEAALKPQ